MDNFQIVLQAIFEKAGIKKSLQELQNIAKNSPVELIAKLNSATIKNDIKKVSSEMAKAIKSIPDLELNISNKDVETALMSIVKNSEKAINAQKRLADQIEKTNAKLREKIQYKIDVGDYDLQIAKLQQGFKNLGLEETEVNKKIIGLTTAYAALIDPTLSDNRIKNEQVFQKELAATKNSLNKAKISCEKMLHPITDLQRVTLSNNIEKWLHDNTAIGKKLEVQIRNIQKQLVDCDDITFRRLEGELKGLYTQAALVGRLGKSFGDTFKTGVQKFSEWGLASGVVMGIVQSFKDMTKNAFKLDNSLLELAKVSDLSASGLAKVTDEAYELGETVGKTGTQTLDAITAAKRAGYELNESMSLAEDALKLTNVAEGIEDAGVAMESLIHILKGSGKDSSYARNILDMINEVSNTQSVDFDNLVDGGERLSAVATQAGMSLEQMFGVLTGGYEVLGNMEKVSSGAITIFTRLQSIQLADEEDVLPVAKLQETINTATKGIVNIVDKSTGQLKDAYSILDDINGVWSTLDKNTQEGIAFAAGGTRQKSVFLSLMKNWDNVKESVESATNSMGSADIENEKYLNSLSGKLAQFQSKFEQLSNTLIDSEMLSFFVDLGTTGVSTIDSIIDSVGGLQTLLGAGTGIALNKMLGWLKASYLTNRQMVCEAQ